MGNFAHLLVRSLTQTERRYFKVFSALGYEAKEKEYVELFRLMEGQEVLNEEVIKRKTGGKYFAQRKRHLAEKILESLRKYHEGSTVTSQINVALENYHLLLKHSFYKQAKSEIKKAETLALNHDYFADIIRIKQAETELVKAKGSPEDISKHIRHLRELLPKLMKQTDNRLAFEREYLLFVKWNMQSEFVRTKEEADALNNSFSGSLLVNESNALSVSAKLLFYYVHALASFLHGDFQNSLKYFVHQIKLYNENEHIRTEQIAQFARALANACLVCVKLGNGSDFDVYYSELNKLTDRKGVDQGKLFYWKYMLRLGINCALDRIEAAHELIQKDGRKIGEIELRMQPDHNSVSERLYVMFDTALVYMCKKEYRKAGKLLNKYLSASSYEFKTDAYCLIRLLILFIELETGDTGLLEGNIKNLKKFLISKGRLLPFEKLSLEFLNKANKASNSAVLTKLFSNFLMELEKMKGRKFDRNSLTYFNFFVWLRNRK